MHPGALVVVFLSFWSITLVGVYLMVLALSNLQQQHSASQLAVSQGFVLIVRQRLFQFISLLLLLLGAALTGSGILFLYMVVYG